MPLPGRDKTFAFESSRDLIEKLRWEIFEFRSTDHIENKKYHAWNGAVTAWSIADWVWVDLSEEQRHGFSAELSVKCLADFQRWLIQKHRPLKLCRLVATASKHAIVTKHNDPSVDTRVYVASDSLSLDDDVAPVLDWSLEITDGVLSSKVEDILDDALHFWTEFVYGRKIAV